MNNITLITSFSDILKTNFTLGDKIIFQSTEIILLMNGSYQGKYVFDDTPEYFITIIGSAFFREEFSINREAVSSQNHLKKYLDLYRNINDKGRILSGFYNVIIINKLKNKTTIISSHFGIRPIFYAVFNKSLLVSTSPEGVIGTNLIKPKTNKSTVLQFFTFNYSINEDTFYHQISSLEAGCQLDFENSKINIKRYFDSIELVQKPFFSYKDSKILLYNELKKIFDKYQNGLNGFSISLTGGWDGRLILALLKNNPKVLNTYSHGSKEDGDILIPNLISKKTKIFHQSYLIDEFFYKNEFINYAIQIVENTSGLRSIARSHYMYSVGNELKNNQNILTGICGSNLMKGGAMSIGPVWNNQINTLLIEPDFNKVKKHIFDFLGKSVFDVLDASNDEVDAFISIAEKIHLGYHLESKIEKRVYRFLLNIVERKYFGNEILSYAHLGENLAPFIDIEFVEQLCKTPYFGGYMKMSGGNIFNNWRNSLLYAYMINSSDPELGKMISDKGVSLYDLSKVYRWPWIMKQQYIKRIQPKAASKYDVESGIESLMNQTKGNFSLKSNQKVIESIENKELKYNLISYLLWSEKNNY